MADKDKFKPLPKPVAASPRSSQVPPSRRPSAPPPPIDPDDFELPPRPTHGNGKRRPPTLSEALVIFFKRLIKIIRLFFSNLFSKTPTQHTRQSKREVWLRKLRRQKIMRLTGFASLAIIIVAVAILLILRFTGDNAYAVYFGEDASNIIGYIPLSEDVDKAKIQAQAVTRLEESLDAAVQTNEAVNITPVNTGAKNISEYDDLVDLVTRSFTYKIKGASLIVKGQEVAVLKSEEEVNAVAERLWEPYESDNTVKASFVEEWRTETKLVDANELGSIDDVLLQLDTKHRALEDYVIKDGETISAIAINNNTTIDKITENTPGLSDPSKVRPGDIIKLEITKPYLSVRTVDEETRTKEIPMPTNTEINQSQPASYKKVIQEGRAGEMEETVRITRVNGLLESEEVIDSKQILEPITRVEEVGAQ